MTAGIKKPAGAGTEDDPKEIWYSTGHWSMLLESISLCHSHTCYCFSLHGAECCYVSQVLGNFSEQYVCQLALLAYSNVTVRDLKYTLLVLHLEMPRSDIRIGIGADSGLFDGSGISHTCPIHVRYLHI